MTTASLYIISLIFAGAMILISALISNAIKYQGGNDPLDPRKRKMWFLILAIITPIIWWVLGSFVLITQDIKDDDIELEKWNNAVLITVGISFVAYILIGFILAKIFKHGKLGNWF
jgi:methionine sulfoxide reductase heme-binding subunit